MKQQVNTRRSLDFQAPPETPQRFQLFPLDRADALDRRRHKLQRQLDEQRRQRDVAANNVAVLERIISELAGRSADAGG